MKLENEEVRRLLDTYLKGNITQEEVVKLDDYLKQLSNAEQKQLFSEIWESLSVEGTTDMLFSEVEKANLLNRIFQSDQGASAQEAERRSLYNWKAAIWVAACSIAVMVGFFWLRTDNEVKDALSMAIAEYPVLRGGTVENVKPGENEAVFMTNGEHKITLKNDFVGVVNRGDDFQIVRLPSGEIQYQSIGTNVTEKWHTVSTPNGGQINFTLPDGTKIWLNAASSIRFRSDMGFAEREVEMLGEVYFEVAKVKGKRFTVKSDFGNIEVLGTKFNVNTYNRENVQTALLEGSIRLNTSFGNQQMRPNQLTTINRAGEMQTEYRDNIQNIIAWTSGYFSFEDTDIETVGQYLARWYNIEVNVSDRSINRKITGTIARDVKLSKMIDMLEYLGLNCFFDNGKLIINTKK